MPTLLLKALLLTFLAFASDFSAGDGVACSQREGVVEKVFSGESLLVKFIYSYFSGVAESDDRVSVERADFCERLLGDANSTGDDEFTKGDGILCGKKEGIVMAAFTNGVAKVHFIASYYDKRYEPINETFLLNVDGCERQVSPGR